jgi:hypothetical protein
MNFRDETAKMQCMDYGLANVTSTEHQSSLRVFEMLNVPLQPCSELKTLNAKMLPHSSSLLPPQSSFAYPCIASDISPHLEFTLLSNIMAPLQKSSKFLPL